MILKHSKPRSMISVLVNLFPAISLTGVSISAKQAKGGGIVELELITGKTPDGKKLIVAKEIYGYVPFAAMEDGLQKEDILIISEKEYENT